MLGRSPGEVKGYPLQYPGLENSMDYNPWGCKELDTTERLSLSLFIQSSGKCQENDSPVVLIHVRVNGVSCSHGAQRPWEYYT